MRLIIVIPTSIHDQATTVALKHDPKGGQHTFTVPLYDVTDAHTHYWCSWGGLSPERYEAILADFRAINAQVFDGDTHTAQSVLDNMQLHVQINEGGA